MYIIEHDVVTATRAPSGGGRHGGRCASRVAGAASTTSCRRLLGGPAAARFLPARTPSTRRPPRPPPPIQTTENRGCHLTRMTTRARTPEGGDTADDDELDGGKAFAVGERAFHMLRYKIVTPTYLLLINSSSPEYYHQGPPCNVDLLFGTLLVKADCTVQNV